MSSDTKAIAGRVLAEFGGSVGEATSLRVSKGSTLPFARGCMAQPAWGFRDPTGRVFYWFFSVYGPEPGKLNQGLSYWAATWLSSGESGTDLCCLPEFSPRPDPGRPVDVGVAGRAVLPEDLPLGVEGVSPVALERAVGQPGGLRTDSAKAILVR